MLFRSTDTDPDTDVTISLGTYVNLGSTGIDFIELSPGSFLMGCTDGQSNCESGEVVHWVNLTHSFEVSQIEVTQEQFEALTGYQPSSHSGCSTCPVEEVSWHESAWYANLVSEQMGLPDCYICTGSGTSVDCEVPTDLYSCTGYRLLKIGRAHV